MPVPIPEPFNPKRYEIEGDPASVHLSQQQWNGTAGHLYQMASNIAISIADVRFTGPEADMWRKKAQSHIDAVNHVARGIQVAGEGLGQWGTSLDTAISEMTPVLISAQADYANLWRAFHRVNLAEAVEVAAVAALTAAESELSAAIAATSGTAGMAGGAIAAASAHVSQASVELTRASAEVVAAHQDHQASRRKWDATNEEADGIQSQLGVNAMLSAGTINVGTSQRHNAVNAMNKARSTGDEAADSADSVKGGDASQPGAFRNVSNTSVVPGATRTISDFSTASQTTRVAVDSYQLSTTNPSSPTRGAANHGDAGAFSMPGIRSGGARKTGSKKNKDNDKVKKDGKKSDTEGNDLVVGGRG
ncbi:hypothetical protein GOEFS_039_00090 [Gordonia effusa NBRC 100432]|uniref:PPE family domain-containing protein n=1 Tax=Gordonia effusa NBRC 100432 TaxID=1077974 RepID=H0QY74_9ACTN|nr:hypothetical protein [Gordonia effusa]GAB17775.1 hypothetical protein GOEFS_039_00090 [Gordonia effusa NBRC 100432]